MKMAKCSCSYRLFLEVDLFYARPALYSVLYSDGFMEYTYGYNVV